MRFAAVQFDIVWEDKAANHAIIEGMLANARPDIEPGTFVLLPELGDTGFSMNLDRIGDAELTLQWGQKIAQKFKIFLQVGYARVLQNSPGPVAAPTQGSPPLGRNCAAIIDPNGTILGEYQKVHPFSIGKESQYYAGGRHLLIRGCGGMNVCPMICYDLRFPELWRVAAMAGSNLHAEVFTIGASWPAARQHHWRALVIARAIENQAYVVAVNRCGGDPHLQYAGGSLIVSPKGEILCEAHEAPQVLQADLDADALRRWREDFPVLRDVQAHLLGAISIA
jgi:omega-amidase